MANKHTTVLEFEVYGKRNIDALKDALNRAGIALELVETQASDTQRQIHNLSAITKMATARLDNLSTSQKKALKNIVNTANLSGKTYAPWIREREILQTEKQVAEEKKLQRELRETERIRRRTERERIESRRRLMRRAGFTDGGADLAGKSVSGPMRVIAYDLVRRSLTEIYGLANKVSKSISEWIVDGIKFNDELARSQTFFTSLGILGFKGVTGGQMTIAEASVSKDPKVADMYKKSVTNSETVMRKLMAVSAMTGQDLGEIVSATRQSMTDLLNKINKDGKPGVYLQNVDTLNNVTERMVKLASVLRMADPQNRKLSFHMVGLQELFSGTTGTGEKGKKESAGLQNVKSLLMREGIKIGEERARQITQYVNKGNLEAAMDVVQDALERSGLGFEQLANMMNSTLQPAIDGTKMYLRIFNKIFTTDLYNRVLKPFFQATLRHFSLMEQDKVFVGAIEKLGRQFSDVTNDIILDFTKVIDYMTLIPDYSTKEGRAKYSINNKEVAGFFTTQTELQNVISTIGGGAKVMYAIFKVIAQFMMGLMGSRDGSQLADVAKQIEGFGKAAKRFGAQLREAFEWVLTAVRTNKLDLFGVMTVKLSDFVKGLLIFLVVLKALKMAFSLASAGKNFIDSIRGIKNEISEWRASRATTTASQTATRTVATQGAAQAASQPGILSRIANAVKQFAGNIAGGLVVLGSGAIGLLGKALSGSWALVIRAASGVAKFFTNKIWEIKMIWEYVIPALKNKFLTMFRSWSIADLLKRYAGGLKELAKDIFLFAGRLFTASGGWAGLTRTIASFIPHVRVAMLIFSVFALAVELIGPMVMDMIERNAPAIMDRAMKMGAKAGGEFLGFGIKDIPTNTSWNLFNAPPVPPTPETKPVMPYKPLVLKSSQDKPTINVNNLNLHGVQSPAQFSDELMKRANKPEKIKEQGLIDPTYGVRK
jgi:type IV secretory pathway VirB2 component (pilin)